VRRAVAQLLAKAGYEVTQAGDGREGMQLWREDPADLVVTDIHMPGQSGLEMIAQLRALAPEVPIIVISGSHDPDDPALPRDLRLRTRLRLVPKPFTLSEILTAARDLLAEAAPRSASSLPQRPT
jgi:CheY-like chemotaxis protein